MHPALVSHLSKLRKTIPSLALLFAMADAMETSIIDAAHTEQSISWSPYLESHARRIYSCVTSARMQAAADRAAKIREGVVGTDGTFARRDVYRHHWTGLDTPDAVGDALEILHDAGWVRPRERGRFLVRQRYCRGDLDVCKSQKSIRDLPMGLLTEPLQRLVTGDPERFVFAIKTRPVYGHKEGICRDDRDINEHFLRPAAKALGFYYKGFGWHSLRREAITNLSAELGANGAQRMAGHSKADMSLHYTLQDRVKEDQAVRRIQERILVGGGSGPVQ